MLENISLPDGLMSAIGSESKEFAVIGKRAKPVGKSLVLLFFSIFWLAFSSFFIIVFLGPLFKGEEVHFTANNVPVVAGPGNLKGIMVPGIILGLFVLIGIGLVISAVYQLFKRGGYFVGTPTRLIRYNNGNIRSIDWEQFTGDIAVRGNDRKGTITLEMRTGTMVSSKGGSRYVPDIIYMYNIPDAFSIEQICRRRIKENDPTPAH
jgi:hypothetical protein